MNQREKEFCNYDSTLTGKGLRIAMIEYYSSSLFNSIKVGNPMNWSDTDTTCPPDDPNNETGVPVNHPFKVASILRDMLPEAQIDFFCTDSKGLIEVIKGDYHIVNFSGTYCWADEKYELELAKKAFLTIGAGNNGSYGESEEAREPQWWAVGAMKINEAGLPDFTSYSGWGKHAVDSMSFGDIRFTETSEIIHGTSFADPFFVGLVGQYIQKYISTFGVRPKIEEIIGFIKGNSYPIAQSPVLEGYGIFKLPKVWNLGFKMKIDSKEINSNGVKKQLKIAPRIEDGNTIVQLTSLRELAGVDVFWDNDTRTITVTKYK